MKYILIAVTFVVLFASLLYTSSPSEAEVRTQTITSTMSEMRAQFGTSTPYECLLGAALTDAGRWEEARPYAKYHGKCMRFIVEHYGEY